MSDTGPSIALLFDDTTLVAQLRDALHACGAHIVHEGGVASVDRQLLQELDADVLVINLDDAAADALDRLYALVDGDRPRLVFNDAAASAALSGWDRARWARHLAVKVLQSGDLDPPRPGPAQANDAETPVARRNGDSITPVQGADGLGGDASLAGVAAVVGDTAEADDAGQHRGDTEALSAELEALLASAELLDGAVGDSAEDDGLLAPDGTVLASLAAPDHSSAEASGLPISLDDLLDAVDGGVDGEFSAVSAPADLPPVAREDPSAAAAMAEDWLDRDPLPSPDASGAPAPTAPVSGLDELFDDMRMEDEPMASLPESPVPAATPLDDPLAAGNFAGGTPLELSALDGGTPSAGAPSAPAPTPAPPSAPVEWALVGEDEPLTPATFGVEKQSAAEFLAPEAGQMTLEDEPVLNLELVSMEEAVAPRPAREAVEMHLDELRVALSRLVLTGATLGGTSAALAFYAALPANTPLAFLHTQHLRGQSVDELVVQLAAVCPLSVALATAGVPTRPGQVLVVPPGFRVRVHRDARVEVQADGEEVPETSIDDSFTKAADVFGRDALAIVFSGHNTDSIAGAKAIHAAGGSVWVEAAAQEYADMVHEIEGAGVVEFSGSAAGLAARLAGKFA